MYICRVQRILRGEKKILDNSTNKYENNSVEIISSNKNYAVEEYYVKWKNVLDT